MGENRRPGPWDPTPTGAGRSGGRRRPATLTAPTAPRAWAPIAAAIPLALVLVANSAAAQPPPPAANEASTTSLHPLSWETLGRWPGYGLNGYQIEEAFVSEPFAVGTAGFAELLELVVRSPQNGRREVRCTFTYSGLLWGFTMACDVRAEGPEVRTTFALLEGGRGRVRASANLEVHWQARNLEALELSFRRPGGTLVGELVADPGRALGGPALALYGPSDAESEAMALLALSSLFLNSTVREPNLVPVDATTVAPRLDAYRPTRARTEEDAGVEGLLAEAEGEGQGDEAWLLRSHFRSDLRIDRALGPYIQRNPGAARVAMGLQMTTGFQPGPEGSAGPWSGGRLEVVGGLRIQDLSFLLTLGLGLGAIDSAAFAAAAGVSDVESALFSFGLETRYALPPLLTVEGVVGLGIAGRLRLTDVAEWPGGGSHQLGLALAPMVGVQLPIWEPNDLGTRLLVALEGSPEFTFWQDPTVRPAAAQEAEANRLAAALSGADFALSIRLGVRFEL